jgi:uncharacterized protein YvpB
VFSTLISLYVSFITFSSQNVSLPHAPIIEKWPWYPEVPTVKVPITKPAVVATPAPIKAAPMPEIKPSKIVDLSVPLRYQIYTLSCESASLQMALEYRGIKKSQDELLKEIGISDPYKSYTENGVMIWGDPNLGFVGNVKGYFSNATNGMRGATGWGVNKDPIARVAREYRSGSEAYSGFTSLDVIRELDDGNPVIFWHVPDSYAAGSITYQTPAGKSIRFFRNHVAVISGYKIVDGKTSFMISDPLYGEYPLQQSTLERRMAKYDGDVVVVR